MSGPYHAEDKYNDPSIPNICGFPKVAIKTKFKGPCPLQRDDAPDILDDIVLNFRANCLFRNFEIKGNGDRLLIYVTLYINSVLGKIANQNKDSANRILAQAAIENFQIPGDKDFILNAFLTPPANRADSDAVRQYLTQIRQEAGVRLCDAVFKADNNNPSKWWLAYAKRKFLNKELK